MSNVAYEVYGVASFRRDGSPPGFEKVVGHPVTGEPRIFFSYEEAEEYANELNRTMVGVSGISKDVYGVVVLHINVLTESPFSLREANSQ